MLEIIMLKTKLSKMRIYHKILLTCFILNAVPLLILAIFTLLSMKQDQGVPHQIFLGAICSLFMVSLFLSSYFAKIIMAPIRELKTKCQEIANSKTKTALPISSDDELGDVTKSFNRMLETICKCEQAVTISQMTRMLAHDVRKPFSLLSSILRTLESKGTPEFLEAELPAMLDDVQKAMNSINGMLLDIVEVGTPSQPVKTPTSLLSLIDMSLSEIVRMHPDAEITFEYSFDDFQTLDVDTNKLPRVLLNIIENAFEAMQGKGKIWFKCQKQESHFTKLIIGNEGPAIRAEVIPTLFDNVSTYAKRGGSGLGLTIAKKIVEAHGGTIWCNSVENKGTEFIFTLPLADTEQRIELSSELPSSSKALLQRLEEARTKNAPKALAKESKVERLLLTHLVQKDRKPKILIVDDEYVYSQLLINMLEKNPELHSRIEIKTANHSEAVFSLLDSFSPDAITLDIDLGKTSKNGLEILKQAREKGFPGLIYLHSNRKMTFEDALNAGANGIEPKPMSRTTLLEILTDACALVPGIPTNFIPTPRVKKIAILDDSDSTLILWKLSLEGENVREFSTPEAFFSAIKEDPEFVHSLYCVITDVNFRPLSTTKGFEVARFIKELNSGIPVFLSTDGDVTQTELMHSRADKIIGKSQINMKELETLIASLS